MNLLEKDKFIVANRIITRLTDLVDYFDKQVAYVKANELEQASEVVKEANKLRIEVKELKKEYEKLNKKSGIILLNNRN